MRPLYRRGHMDQVLLTFGFTFVFFDLVQAVWGRVIVRLPAPEILQGAEEGPFIEHLRRGTTPIFVSDDGLSWLAVTDTIAVAGAPGVPP